MSVRPTMICPIFCGPTPIPVEPAMQPAADPTILFLIMGFGLLAVLWCLYKAIRI